MSGLENRKYGHGDPLRWPRDNLFPQKWATNGGRSVGIVRLRNKTTEFSFFSRARKEFWKPRKIR
jgi:hypothetical protein